jgi:hypothetical protein
MTSIQSIPSDDVFSNYPISYFVRFTGRIPDEVISNHLTTSFEMTSQPSI